jgi:CheY-like chemotaxis protein
MSDLKKILHVDDDEDIRTIAQMSLEMVGGFDLVQCASGKEALVVAPTFLPDLLLLDVMMPEMTGEELWKDLMLMPALADTPAIFMTAKVEHSFLTHLLRDGALAIVEKPFDPMELSQEILAAWNTRRHAA